MSENWLQKTVDVPKADDDLMGRYGPEQIDSITSTETYELAKAALALALNDGLSQMPKKAARRAAKGLFDKLLNGLPVIFLLGYDQACKERGKAPSRDLEEQDAQ